MNVVRAIKYLANCRIIDISDEYINWLCFGNAGMLNRGNLYCFDYAIKNLPSENPVIEIGSFCGLSTNIINYYLNKYQKNNKIFSCDKWIFEGAESATVGDSEILHDDYKTFIKETFVRNVSFFSGNNLPYTIEEFSDEFFELWNQNKDVFDVFNRQIKLGGQISFCYVDGNHSYEFSKRDFENIDQYLENGGYILFDDSNDYSNFGCAKLMKEIIRNENYNLIKKNPNYLFQKK